ncbi:DUF2478 domain-containing protein [Bradyrhizobium australiense]|uniref:DUF2478 domain-containing protein n=1 Tax=Bradyrhizobium australiense TaxID=2721161 RepID=UPI001F276764|nr:DUF2478 domain-containing protein [Bradyrhizobium australiense]
MLALDVSPGRRRPARACEEFADAIIAGVPLLTAVPEKYHAAWRTFTGDVGTTLLC